MTTCLYCHQQAMSQLKKSCLGPALSAQCEACGKRLSVPPAAMLAVIPFLLSIILAGLVSPHSWQFSVMSLLAGISAMVAIHGSLVPLVPRA